MSLVSESIYDVDEELVDSSPLPVEDMERLNIDPFAAEQKLPADPTLYTEQVLTRLQSHYDIFIEKTYNKTVIEDGDQKDWVDLSKVDDPELRDLYKIRHLTSRQPHCVRALMLYVLYVFGSDFTIELVPINDDGEEVSETEKKKNRKVTNKSRRLWEQFLEHNNKKWGVFEFGKRVWRDGSQFTWKKSDAWPPEARFIDRECIDTPMGESEDTEGIITDDKDVTEVLGYQVVDPDTKELIETLDADRVVHTKIDCDSNEKHGRSRFLPIVKSARLYEAFVENEVTHRQAQASIVLVRKVPGRRGPSRVYDNARTSTTDYQEGSVNREKWRPGTILTVTPDVEVDFAQPHSDFSDASPLAKLLLQQICVATGFTYGQITQDATGGSFAAELVHESPVLQMIRHEQAVIGVDLKAIFKWVIEVAVSAGKLEGVSTDSIWDEYEPALKFFDPVSRDPLKLAQFLNLLVISQIISRTHARRELNLDNDRIVAEIKEEKEDMMTDMAFMQNASGTNPTEQDRLQSSRDNANKGGGQNQGGNNEPTQHRDRLPGKSTN